MATMARIPRAMKRVQPFVLLVVMAVNLVTEARAPSHVQLLLEQYGTQATVNRPGFERLLTDLLHTSSHLDSYLKAKSPPHGVAGSSNDTSQDSSVECYDVDRIFVEFAGSEDSKLNASGLDQALSAAIFALTSPLCESLSNGTQETQQKAHLLKPSSGEAWGYGIGIVTLICFISNIGGFLGPIMNKPYFKKILIFLVALAVGALAGTGILVLIPEAFNVMNVPELEADYLWKAAMVVVGLYVFYWSERLMKIGLRIREASRQRRKGVLDREEDITMESESLQKSLKSSVSNGGVEHVEQEGHKGPIKTVAWMVMLGDALHNFVDGLSIGAALTENLYTALSISIAVLCEEFPHELGDIAILLHSGLSMKRALLINFLTAAIAYVGLVIGILLGENTEANRWIFAVAAGIFLYVSLVDMLPEMSETAEQYAHSYRLLIPVLVLQTIGLLVGFVIILVVAHFSKMINVG